MPFSSTIGGSGGKYLGGGTDGIPTVVSSWPCSTTAAAVVVVVLVLVP